MRNPEVIKALAALDAEAAYDAKLLLAAALYRALQRAVFVLPKDDEISALSGHEVAIRTGMRRDGRRAVLVYTDFDVAPADIRYEVMPFVELCRQIAPMEIAVDINPDSYGGVVSSYWVRAIAEGLPEMPRLPTGTFAESQKAVEIAPLGDVTPGLRQRLTDGLVARPSISTAYFVRARFEGHAGLLVAVCFDAGPPLTPSERLGFATGLYAWVLPAMRKGDEIYFRVDPDETLVAQYKLFGPPFYRRSS